MKRITVIIISVLISFQLKAQENVLEEYIKQGLESNLVIKQNNLALESARQSLKIAKGMFMPKINTQSRYTLAKGGRTINFPIGDLMNPVYNTLNDMIVAQGGSPRFPTVQNEQINFLREQEYEVKISLTQPLYYPSLAINKRIEEQKLFMSQTELEQYKRELTFQIKEAYYNYMKALLYSDLIQKTKNVVNENHRVSQKLMNNDLITRDVVLRAKSEISKIELYETEAGKNIEMAKSYFNFLLNRGLNEEIVVCSHNKLYATPQLDEVTESALFDREELKLIEHQLNIMDNVVDLSKADMLPKLFLAVDYGIQGEKFEVDGDSDFIMGSFVLNWDLFNGNVNKNKKKKALIEKQLVQFKKEEISNRIQLEIKQNLFELEEKLKNKELAKTRSIEASEVYRIIEKKYGLGEASLIELLDARNNMTEAESQSILTNYDYLISIARLEKNSNTSLTL